RRSALPHFRRICRASGYHAPTATPLDSRTARTRAPPACSSPHEDRATMTTMPPKRPSPVLLCILDGWGCSDQRDDNAIALAHNPVWDRLMRTMPHALLDASELHVGLPTGQMGNSEVGHMNVGAGRKVMQDLPRIDEAFARGEVGDNRALRAFVAALRRSGG